LGGIGNSRRQLMAPVGIEAVSVAGLIGKATIIMAKRIIEADIVFRIDTPRECRRKIIRAACVQDVAERLRDGVLIIDGLCKSIVGADREPRLG